MIKAVSIARFASRKLRRELEELSGGSFVSGGFGETSPELEKMFLEQVCAYDKAELDTNFNRLVQRGVVMIPPEELDDANLHAKLQEVLCKLAEICCFLHNTDHLSDRELYTWLWTDGLREETPDVARLGGAWHTSPIGSCTDEDIAISLKYYASEKERRHWKKEFPDDPLPPHCVLRYDRDRNLPRGSNSLRDFQILCPGRRTPTISDKEQNEGSSRSRDAIASTRDGRAPQNWRRNKMRGGITTEHFILATSY